jgi:hypothetical protein
VKLAIVGKGGAGADRLTGISPTGRQRASQPGAKII